MENIDYKTLKLTEETTTNTEVEERVNEIGVFKEDCNMHLRTLSEEYSILNGLLTVLESVMKADDVTDFSTCEVIKLLKEESDNLQETTMNFIFPTEEEGQITEGEDLQALKKEYKKFLKTMIDETMRLNGVASVLVEAMLNDEENSKIRYVFTVKMAVKKLNDIMERIVFLLKD